MMDLGEKGSGSEDMSSKYPDGVSSEESHVKEHKKSCTDCQTTKTPLWRGGPAGPRSLCNACGIRNRKKRRALLGLKKGGGEKEKKYRRSSNTKNRNDKMGVSVKLRLVALGREVTLQRSSEVEKQRRKLGEEEEAAVLLMALSCGYVYA